MNTTQNTPRRIGALLAAALLAASSAGAVTLVITPSTTSVAVGNNVTFTLSVTGWNSGDGEVDSINFNVDFDTTYWSYVGYTNLATGAEFLAESNQGAGYVHSDDVDDSTFIAFGRFIYGASDAVDTTAGSIGGLDGGGLLGTVTLQATTETPGTNVVTSSSGGSGNVIFGDENDSLISPSSFSHGSTTIEIIPEPGTGILAVLAACLLLRVRRR